MCDKNDTFGTQDAESSEGVAHCETKLNLLCRADQLDTFIDAPAIAQIAPGEWKRSLLTALYFDTSDFDLRKNGFVLRVENDGRQYLMTLKSQRTRRNGASALARNEWAAPVSEMRPDVSMLIDILPPEIVVAIQHSELNPLFSTEVKRMTRILAVPNGTVELAIDRGCILAGKRVEEISELELELKAGQPRAIFELAQNLATIVPLRPSTHSKSDRGFELAFKKPPELSRAVHKPHNKNVNFGSLLVQTLRSIYQNMMDSQAAAEDGRDPEGIHQFRIALRRLRAILKLIQPFTRSPQLVAFKDEAKWLLNQLNDVRDWDVFQTETFPKIVSNCNDVEGFEAIETGARKLRMKARERAREALREQRVGQFQLALGLWIEQEGWRNDRVAMPNVFKQTSKKCGRKLLKMLNAKLLRFGRHIEKLSTADQHEVRIAIKKLRYAADFLIPSIHHGKDGRRYLKRVAELQDQLGRLNDDANLRKMLMQILNGKYPHSARPAAGAVIGWHAGAINTNSDKLQSAWKAFRKVSSLR